MWLAKIRLPNSHLFDGRGRVDIGVDRATLIDLVFRCTEHQMPAVVAPLDVCDSVCDFELK